MIGRLPHSRALTIGRCRPWLGHHATSSWEPSLAKSAHKEVVRRSDLVTVRPNEDIAPRTVSPHISQKFGVDEPPCGARKNLELLVIAIAEVVSNTRIGKVEVQGSLGDSNPF